MQDKGDKGVISLQLDNEVAQQLLDEFGSLNAVASAGTASAAPGPMRPSVRAARQRRPPSGLDSSWISTGTASVAADPIRARAAETTTYVSGRESAAAREGTASCPSSRKFPSLHAAKPRT